MYNFKKKPTVGMIVYPNKENMQDHCIFSNGYIPFYWGMYFKASDIKYHDGKDSLNFEISRVDKGKILKIYYGELLKRQELEQFKIFLDWLEKLLDHNNFKVLISGLDVMFDDIERSDCENNISNIDCFNEIINYDFTYYTQCSKFNEDYETYISRYGCIFVDMQPKNYFKHTREKIIKLNKEKLKIIRSQLWDNYFKLLMPIFILILVILLFSSTLTNLKESNLLKGGSDSIKSILAHVFFGGIGLGAGYGIYSFSEDIKVLSKQRVKIKRLIRKYM